jgi:DNA-binding NtrC family response regulator
MKASIFYLDDEACCLELFREEFDGEYDVRTAATPEEARRMLAERPADVVISDQTMPDISGKVFLAEVAARHPSAYRVLLTGNLTAGDAISELSVGVVQAFVAKPWGRNDIARVLERGLADDLFW